MDLLESKLNSAQDPDALSPPSTKRPRSGSQRGDAQWDTLLSGESSISGPSEHQFSDNYSRYSGTTPARNSDDDGGVVAPLSSSDSQGKEVPWLSLPGVVALELIHLFFDKVQPWLPLLHRPRFLARYVGEDGSTLRDVAGFNDEDALIVYSMFALAACHSSNPYFQNIPAHDRGDRFAETAKRHYFKLREKDTYPTIKCLQGSVLLASYICASGPCHASWILIGVCVRMAYELNLCNMDEVDSTWQTVEEWTDKEERRRLFWVVWELDAFGSTIMRRPSAINRQRIAVRLPVNDTAWFAQEPVESALPGSRPSEAWKCLLGSPNQNERAWFLLANYLMAFSFDMVPSGRISTSEHIEITDALACFNLAMSQRFSLETHAVLFDLESFTKHNWIIGMHLMVNSARACVSALDPQHQTGSTIWTREFSRIVHHWHPQTVVLSHPFLACTLLTPQVIFINEPLHPNHHVNSNAEIFTLMLAQFGSVWKLGSALIGRLQSCCSVPWLEGCHTEMSVADALVLINRGQVDSEKDAELAKQFPVFFPADLTSESRRRLSQSSPVTSKDSNGENNVQVVRLSSEGPLAPMNRSEQDEQMDNSSGHFSVGDCVDRGVLDEVASYQRIVSDDWSSLLQVDYVCDDKQHFNYFQL